MQLIELVKRGSSNFTKVLDFLGDNYNDTSYRHEIILLQSQLADYQRNKRMRLESDDNINNIGFRICRLIESIENEFGTIQVEEVVPEVVRPPHYRPKIFFEDPCWMIILVPILILYVVLLFKLSPQPKTDNSNVPPINSIYQVGYDKSHKKLSLYIDILDQQGTWTKDGIITAEYVYNKTKINLEIYFKNQNYLDKINNAQNIICLGNSSYEEDLKIPAKFRKKQEEDRASIRAKHLQGIIRKLAKSTVMVHTANLGQYKIADPLSSNSQRSIIIIRVMQKEDGVNMNQALYDALNKTKELPFDIHQFSLARDEYLDIDTD